MVIFAKDWYNNIQKALPVREVLFLYIHTLNSTQSEQIRQNEVRYETMQCEDADYLIVSFGSAARISEKALENAREEGIKVGLFRPITLFPFPYQQIAEMAKGKKGVLVAEINAGQMVEDVKLAVNGAVPVEYFGRLGGIVPDPDEIVNAIKTKLM